MFRNLIVIALVACPLAAQAADFKGQAPATRSSRLQQALAVSGGQSADSFYALGNSLTHLGRYQEAITAYQKALRLNPDQADVHNKLGAVYAQLGRWADAVREGEETLRIDPNHRIAALWLPLAKARLREAQIR